MLCQSPWAGECQEMENMTLWQISVSLVQFGTCALSKLSSVCEELSHALHYLECVKSHKSSLISKECQFDPARYSESNLNWCSTSPDMKGGLNKQQTDSHTIIVWANSPGRWRWNEKEVLRILCRKVEVPWRAIKKVCEGNWRGEVEDWCN